MAPLHTTLARAKTFVEEPRRSLPVQGVATGIVDADPQWRRRAGIIKPSTLRISARSVPTQSHPDTENLSRSLGECRVISSTG